MGILGLNKQAFNIYAGLTAARAIIQVIGSLPILFMYPANILTNLMPFILTGLLLFVIYKTDGKYFGGGKISEPISVIRARQRREREAKENT